MKQCLCLLNGTIISITVAQAGSSQSTLAIGASWLVILQKFLTRSSTSRLPGAAPFSELYTTKSVCISIRGANHSSGLPKHGTSAGACWVPAPPLYMRRWQRMHLHRSVVPIMKRFSPESSIKFNEVFVAMCCVWYHMWMSP